MSLYCIISPHTGIIHMIVMMIVIVPKIVIVRKIVTNLTTIVIPHHIAQDLHIIVIGEWEWEFFFIYILLFLLDQQYTSIIKQNCLSLNIYIYIYFKFLFAKIFNLICVKNKKNLFKSSEI